MKTLKLCVLTAIATAAFASVAVATSSATTLNLSAGYPISSEAEGTTSLHPPIGEINCGGSKVEAKTTNEGGAGEAVNLSVQTFSFTSCNATVTVLSKGTLAIQTSGESANNNGAVRSTGAEVTVSYLGFHCIFKTNNTSIGTLTGSANTGGNATLDISGTIPRTGGGSGAFCGSTAAWTGSYAITAPNPLNVDGPSGEVVALDGGVGAPSFTAIVGKNYLIKWKNVTANKYIINIEANTNAAVVQTNGKPCGEIPGGVTCESREFKCLEVGESTLELRENQAVRGILLVKCHKE